VDIGYRYGRRLWQTYIDGHVDQEFFGIQAHPRPVGQEILTAILLYPHIIPGYRRFVHLNSVQRRHRRGKSDGPLVLAFCYSTWFCWRVEPDGQGFFVKSLKEGVADVVEISAVIISIRPVSSVCAVQLCLYLVIIM
jgi:hypothetical protein